MSSFRILSIDGGGIRATLPAIILKRIIEEVPDLVDETQFFAGTSTGALIAVSLAYGIPAIELLEILKAFVQEVMKRNLVNRVGQVVGTRYDILNLVKILGPYFGAAVLQDILKIRGKYVLVPAFDLDGMIGEIRTWKPKFYHNFPVPGADIGELVLDVIARSSATPVFFGSYQGFIGGTVVARNPSMSALAQALEAAPQGLNIKDIRLLSLGTGYFPRYITGAEHDWGLGRWSWPLISMVLDSDMGVSTYQCMRILGPERFHRLQPILKEPVGLDETDKLPNLEEFAAELNIGPTVEWIKTYFLDQDDSDDSTTETEETDFEDPAETGGAESAGAGTEESENETTSTPEENGNGNAPAEGSTSALENLIRILRN